MCFETGRLIVRHDIVSRHYCNAEGCFVYRRCRLSAVRGQAKAIITTYPALDLFRTVELVAVAASCTNRSYGSYTVRSCASLPHFDCCLLYLVENCLVHSRWRHIDPHTLPAAAAADVGNFVLAAVAVLAAEMRQSDHKRCSQEVSYLLIPLISAELIRLLLLRRLRRLFLLLLLLCAGRQVHLRMHLLYLCKVAVHEIAKQHLGI